MQLTIFFLRFISKGIICILERILKTLNFLEGMCDLNKYHQSTFVIYNMQSIWTGYTNIRTEY